MQAVFFLFCDIFRIRFFSFFCSRTKTCNDFIAFYTRKSKMKSQTLTNFASGVKKILKILYITPVYSLCYRSG